jgi:hypothetical protein
MKAFIFRNYAFFLLFPHILKLRKKLLVLFFAIINIDIKQAK